MHGSGEENVAVESELSNVNDSGSASNGSGNGFTIASGGVAELREARGLSRSRRIAAAAKSRVFHNPLARSHGV